MMQEYTTDGTNDSSEELHVVSGQLLTLNDPIEVMDTVVSKNNNITSPLQLIQDVVDDDVNFFDIEQGKQVDNVDNNYDDNKDDDELIVIKGRSLEMNDQLPDWASVVDQDSKSNLITTAINKHITDKTLIDRLNKFSIRLHNALYSIDNSINLSAKAIVTAKISLLPVPAKAFILRSSIPIPTSISSPSSSPNSLTSTTSTTTAIHQQYYDFSFGKKIASLSMSAGDVRSKSFKDGACPRLNIDLNLSNGETIFNSNLQLYLPQLLLSYQSGQLLSLPLVNTSSNSILATIIIELICPQKNSTISDNNIINIVYKDKSNHANSINKNIFIFNSKIIALTGKSLVNIKSEVLDEAKNKYYVDVKLTASGGISKRIDLKLNPTFRSEYLEFNHDEDNVKNTNNNDHHHPDSLLDMKSINPGLDILNLSFRRGPYDEDELGFIQIPIIFLQNLDLAGKSSDLLIALIAWKMIINVDQRCMFTSSKFSFIWKLLSIHPILDTENLQLNDRNEEVDHDDGDGDGGIVDKNIMNSTIDVNDSDSRLLPSSQGSVKSITGQLLCCIEGLFINRGSNKDSTLNSDKGFTFSKGSTIGLEIILWPEGTKTTSLLCIPIILPKENDIEAIVEIKKTFNMLITVALQQRLVSFLQFNIFQMKKTSAKLPVKSLICSQRLDLSSIAIYSEGSIFKFLLPVTSTYLMTADNKSLDIVCGWLLIGIQFKSTAIIDGNIQVHAIKLENIMKDTWNICISFPMKVNLGLKTNYKNDINHGNNGINMAISNRNISNCDLHVALSKIEFSNHPNINDVHDDNLYQSCISCMILISNDMSNTIVIVGRITNQRVVWDVNDVVLSFQRDVTLSFSIQFFLFKGNNQLISENIIGESLLLINQNQLTKGLPLNFILPFRNNEKDRVALLAMSVQATSLIDNINIPSASTDNYNNYNNNNINFNTLNYNENKIPLLIEFCEGNIVSNVNPNLILEPFFECSLFDEKKKSHIDGNNYNATNNNDNSVEKTRTGFLRFTETLENWNLDCMLNLPSINYNNNNDNSSLTDSQVSLSAYSIGIICRNASQQGCPQLGWTKIAIPSQLLFNHSNKPHEQWITLSPPSIIGGNSINSSMPLTYNNDSNVVMKVCRIKIRLSIDYVNHDMANNPFGIGVVLIRMMHVNDNRLGISDAIISTTASSHSIESHVVESQMNDKIPPVTVPESSNVDDENDDALFSQMDFHTVSYINEMSMFNEDNLVAALPVFGGYCDIKLKLRTLTTNISYVTSFPVMASVPKLSSSLDSSVTSYTVISPQMNSLTLAINKMSNKSSMNCKDINRSRIEPKVNIETIFVPYVKGKLVIQCQGIQFEPIINNLSGNNRKEVSTKNNGDSCCSTFALRYLLGNNSSKFMFSNPFDIIRNKNEVNNRNQQIILENVTFLDVDTFEVLSNSIRRKENSRMMPLFISLLELQSLSPSSTQDQQHQQQQGSNKQQQTCVGIGFVSTAMLYFHALRSAASCSLYTNSGNSNSGSSTNIGSSPWLISNIEIFDPKTKLKKATITLNIKFILNSFPSHVLQMIDNSISKSFSDSTALVRIELGLKQSFVMADVDKSGTVSSEELLNVIKSSSSSSSSPSKSDNNNNNYNSNNNMPISQKSGTIGLDQDARILLLHLSDKSLRGNEFLDDKTLHKIVQDIFEQTDIDGNGTISWWEWKTVLVASIKGKDITSKFINPLDILCVGIQAASDALLTLVPNINENHIISTLPYLSDTQVRVPYILDALDNASYISGQQSQSKSVSKLHSLVKSLRLTNNILSKRLESALSTAQILNIDIDNDNKSEMQQTDVISNNNSNNYTNNNKSYLLEINQLEKRIADTEIASSKHIISYVEAQKQTEDLNKQIIDLKNTNEFLIKRTQENTSNSSEYINKLNDQIEQHNLSLKLAKDQRSLQQKANLQIMDFLKSKGVPAFRRRKTKKQMIRLNHVIATLFHQKKYYLSRQRKQLAAITIQSVVRRRQVKKKISKQKIAVLKIQCCIRSKWARVIMFGLLTEKEEREEREAREKKKREENEAARLLLLLKNNSSSLISKNVRKYANKNALKRKIKRELDEKEKREKREREEKEAREKKEREEKEAREKKEREEKETREKIEREEKEAREKKEREEIEAREKKEKEEEVAREKKEREEKLARRILFILQNKSSKVLLKFIRSCAEKNKLMKKIKRDREEKEQKSIKSIQDAARRRLYYQIRKLLQEQNSILPVTKPGLSEHVKNYWIGFLRGDVFKSSIDTSKQNEQDVPQHFKFGYYNRGKIMNIDEGSRLLDVKYLHRREEGGQYVLQIKNNKIPYDHPLVVWYHADKGVNIPTMIDFFEEISSIGTSEDTEAIDVDIEALIHSHSGPFKPLLSDCIGYFITYKVNDEMVQPIQNIKVKTKFLSGKVVGIDSEKELIAVYYDPKVVMDSNQSSSSSYRSVWISYNSPHLYWHKNDLLLKAYKKKRALKPKISQNPSLSVKKPINIHSSVGYKVGIKANEIRTNGEADALYSGVIKYVKVNENKIVVRYDQINNDHHHTKLSFPSTLGSSAVVVGGADSVIDDNDDDVEEFDFDSSLIVWLIAPSSNRPESIIDTIGYKIELNSNITPDQIKYPVVFHPGVIISADIFTYKVKILFDIQVNQLDNNDDNENNSIDIEEIDWMSDRLTWLYPTSPRFTPEGHVYSDKEVVPRPSNIWRTKGHYVEVKFKHNDLITDDNNDNNKSHNVRELVTNDELYAGQVTEVYSHNRTVKIVYETRLDLDYQPNMEVKEDSEILPWDSEDILWVVHDPSKQRMKNRPIHIKDSKDWLIEVASKEIDAEEDDVYIGRIIAYDERTREVIVRFDSEELDTLDMNLKEHDYEKLPFLSSDIHWLKFAPIQSLSGDRIHFSDAKGWKVEIDSKELDAKDGDVYCGKVVSIDNDHWTVKVQFENDKDDSNNNDENSNNDDFDDFSFGSPFIHWIEGPLKPLIVKARQSSLPTGIDDAIGWEVEVEVDINKDDDQHHHHHVDLGPGDVYCGRVISINNVDNDVKIKFDGDGNASDDDCEDFPFDSKIIHWIQKSTINIDHDKNVNPIVKADDKHVAVVASVVVADEKHVAVDAPIVKADDQHVAADAPIVKANDKHVAVVAPIVKADDKHVAPIVKADDKHVAVVAPIVKADDKHVAVVAPIIKAGDQQVAVDATIIEADDKHVVPIVKADDKHIAPLVKADDKNVAVDAPIVKADDKHVAAVAPIVQADEKHVAVDAPIVKADDIHIAPIVKADVKHVAVVAPIVKADDKHVSVVSPIVKADDKHVAVVAPIVKADEKHVAVDAPIVKADDKHVSVVAPIVQADEKHVAVVAPIVKADDKHVAPIVKADDKHVAVDAPIVKADDQQVAVEAVPVDNGDDLHPSSIEDAVGWIVLVDIDDNSGQLNDAFSGIVVDINHVTQEVKIRFNVDDDEADEDSEYFPYLSTSLHWVEKVLTSSSNDVSDHHDSYNDYPSETPTTLVLNSEINVENAKTNSSIAVDVNNNNNLSVVEIMNKEPTNISKLLPSSIDDAIGWEVDIDSTDPDAKPGDVHCGTVISIDRNNGKVRIKFDIDDDNIDDDDDADDYEDISFNSLTIHWIRHDAT